MLSRFLLAFVSYKCDYFCHPIHDIISFVHRDSRMGGIGQLHPCISKHKG